MSSPFSLGTRVLGGGALLLAAFLFVGWLLPGTWSAAAEAEIEAPAQAVLRYLDGTEGWRSWTTWPDSGTVTEGPRRGAGSRLSWDTREFGDGVFEIASISGDSLVRYRVAVQGGAMRTEGEVRIGLADGAVRVRWTEEGDFGANPLMGYWARLMPKAQSREMEKSLRRLKEIAEADAGPGDRS